MVVSMTIGKKAMAKAIRILEFMPAPSQTTNIGAMAAFGTV
jgi:hypothetical protein